MKYCCGQGKAYLKSRPSADERLKMQKRKIQRKREKHQKKAEQKKSKMADIDESQPKVCPLRR